MNSCFQTHDLGVAIPAEPVITVPMWLFVFVRVCTYLRQSEIRMQPPASSHDSLGDFHSPLQSWYCPAQWKQSCNKAKQRSTCVFLWDEQLCPTWTGWLWSCCGSWSYVGCWDHKPLPVKREQVESHLLSWHNGRKKKTFGFGETMRSIK